MARYRLSGPAKDDISSILRTSETRHGLEARIRYRGLLTAAMRRAAADPQGRATMDRSELLAGLRSLHIRHGRNESQEAPVGDPVHVIFHRAIEPELIEVVRVPHDRMEPSRRVDSASDQKA